jgi:hypothetical protein
MFSDPITCSNKCLDKHPGRALESGVRAKEEANISNKKDIIEGRDNSDPGEQLRGSAEEEANICNEGDVSEGRDNSNPGEHGFSMVNKREENTIIEEQEQLAATLATPKKLRKKAVERTYVEDLEEPAATLGTP